MVYKKLLSTLRCFKRDTGLSFGTFQAGYIGGQSSKWQTRVSCSLFTLSSYMPCPEKEHFKSRWNLIIEHFKAKFKDELRYRDDTEGQMKLRLPNFND